MVANSEIGREHHSYLTRNIGDPRPSLLAELQKTLGDSGSIIAYNKGCEEGCLRDSATSFPEYSDWIDQVCSRLVDLLSPFSNFHYYHPTQKGSASLKKVLLVHGATYFELPLPPGIPQEFDFAFTFGSRTAAVEVEKTNREKILRDILKCHMYIHAGADFVLVGLPKNYPHAHGVWDLFEFGVKRLSECKAFGFGTADKLGRILLLGYEQFVASTNEPLSKETRQEMRKEVIAQRRHPPVDRK